MPTSLRQALLDAPPRDFALKLAWREVIRASRARKRQSGSAGRITGLADVQRVLDAPLRADAPPEAVSALKSQLRALLLAVQGHTTPEQAAQGQAAQGEILDQIDTLVELLVPRIAEGEVAVHIEGWPDGVADSLCRRLAGVAPRCQVSALEAAQLQRDWHGFALAGRTLAVHVDLPPGQVLPAPGRRDKSKRGRPAPWLPHLDEAARYSLTPRALARANAELLGTDVIIDAFCGAGGDAIAAALSGRRVIAIERDPGRAALARQNARALGASIELHEGDAAHLLPELLERHPGAGLYLDPPWGGPDWNREGVEWAALTGELHSALTESVGRAPAVLIKAPRAFDPATLPARVGGWRVHCALEAHQVKFLQLRSA